MATSVLETISSEFSTAAERAGGNVVAVHARRWLPTSGIEWKEGVIVTVHHAVRRDDDIKVLRADGQLAEAKLAGRDPTTDLAVLRVEKSLNSSSRSGAPKIGDATTLKLGHLVLALGRTRRGELVASSGRVGGISGEWKSWRGGRLDQHIRLDLALYPGFSGGPLVNWKGEIAGVNTRGLSRGRAVTIPVATVNRVVDELLDKGHISRPYLGIAMQPVELPASALSQLPTDSHRGLVVLHVESGGPADKAGVLLGDVIVEFAGKRVEDVGAIQDAISSAKIGDAVSARLLRAGQIKTISIALGERPL
jgi:S1-C subfamily serine protease